MCHVGFKCFILKFRPWLVVFTAASFFFLVNSATNLGVITPYLSTKFHFSASKIGFLFACYYYSNIIFVFFAGIILDKTSVKKTLIISFIIANCSILIFAMTKSFALMALSRLALGVVGSFSLLSCFQLIKRWFPSKKTALVTGLATTYAALGTLFSQTPLMLAIEKFGWRAGLLLNFWLGILLCIMVIVFVQDFPPNTQQSNAQQLIAKSQITAWIAIKKTLTNYQNWLVGFYTSLFTFPGLFFNASWGILYLQQVGNLTAIDSSYVVTAGIIGNMLGSPLIGWLSDKFYSRKLPLIICAFVALAILVIITYGKNIGLLPYVLLFFLFGIILGSQVVIFPLIAENNSSSLVGAATGFVATLTALSGAYMPFLGWTMDYYTNSKQVVDGTISNYYPIMLVLISVVIVSMFLILFIKETHGQQQK